MVDHVLETKLLGMGTFISSITRKATEVLSYSQKDDNNFKISHY